jgi:hypothetical protein
MPFLITYPTVYCLASQYDRLTPEQQIAVTHILADDGTWTEEQIIHAIYGSPDPIPLDDWTRP